MQITLMRELTILQNDYLKLLTLFGYLSNSLLESTWALCVIVSAAYIAQLADIDKHNLY